MTTENNPMRTLLDIMARLRDPESGCPWDREQTYATIVPYTLEEAYEVADAIERSDFEALKGELGDLLFQVVYYCQFAREEGRFEFDDVVRAISEKLVRRHPHVFGDETGMSIPELHVRWEQFKAEERAEKAGRSVSVLDDVPHALPALARAQKLQKRAASVGFDWPSVDGVFDKVAEEIAELKAEIGQSDNSERVSDELGDLLFALVNLSRHWGLKAEDALRQANAKFERRFRAVEARVSALGKSPRDLPLGELDALWDEVKREEKNRA